MYAALLALLTFVGLADYAADQKAWLAENSKKEGDKATLFHPLRFTVAFIASTCPYDFLFG
eukprot:g234.t1